MLGFVTIVAAARFELASSKRLMSLHSYLLAVRGKTITQGTQNGAGNAAGNLIRPAGSDVKMLEHVPAKFPMMNCFTLQKFELEHLVSTGPDNNAN